MTNPKGINLKQTPHGKQLAVDLGKSLRTKFESVALPSQSSKFAPEQPDKTLLNFFRVSNFGMCHKNVYYTLGI